MLSVVMPIYNSEKHLRSSIQSVLNQSFGDFELILIDDCSTDSSVLIIDSFNDKRIKYFRNNFRLGPYASYHEGVLKSEREYLTFFDHDDLLHIDKFKLQLNYMVNKKVNICGTNYFVINSTNKIIYKSTIQNKCVNKELLYKPFVFHNPTVMLSKSLINKHGFFKTDTLYCSDYEFYLYLTKFENLIVIPDHLYFWRFSKSSFSHNNIKIINCSTLKIAKCFIESSDLFSAKRKQHDLILIYYFTDNLIKAAKQLIRYAYNYPINRDIILLFLKIFFLGSIIKILRKLNVIYHVKAYFHRG